jgi:hypothetical protein
MNAWDGDSTRDAAQTVIRVMVQRAAALASLNFG